MDRLGAAVPLAFLIALACAQRFGWFWAEISGRVKERAPGGTWEWEIGTRRGAGRRRIPLPRACRSGSSSFAPFVGLVLVIVGATAIIALRHADDDALMLATKLLAKNSSAGTSACSSTTPWLDSPPSTDAQQRERCRVRCFTVRRWQNEQVGAFIVDRAGRMVASIHP